MSRPASLVVINDDPVQLRLMSRVLSSGGHAVTAYTDSSEAMLALGEGPTVDLFVVDLHMPGIDGWKVCRLLRSPDLWWYNTTPILVCSATFTGADVEAITKDLGANAFVPLPFHREDLLEDVADLLRGQRPRTRLRALLVEDDDTVARAAAHAFQAHGYEVHRATTLVEAQRIWTRVSPDAVVLDYHLPDGDSVDLLSELQSPAERTVVLFTTGDPDPKLPLNLFEYGADGFVRKPFDPALLVELVGKARRERSLLRVEALLERRTQELRGSEMRYRSLFEAIPDLVVALDASNRVVSVNSAALDGLGCDRDDVLLKDVSEFIPAEEIPRVQEMLRGVRAQGRAHFETKVGGSLLSPIHVEVTAAAVNDPGEESLLLVARDLTERRRSEEERRRLDGQMQHAQRLKSLGVLAGGIAHDFNNLLVGVLGNASLALLDVEPGTAVHECVTQIETAARRAAELTQQILTFAGKGDSVMAPLDLSLVVEELGRLIAPAVSKKAVVSYRLARGLPLVEVDASQMRQVAMNLIMNASDALHGEVGSIAISTGLVTLSESEVREHHLGESAPAGLYVVLEVADDGCGMDETTRRQIFDPFFTTKFSGRGLGLASTLGIVRAHRGLLSVETAPARGTTFRVLLPALEHPRPLQPDGTDDRREEPWNGVGSILVIDDEPAVRQLTSACLKRAGYHVIEAGDGRAGLEWLEREPMPDLVVIDLTMPVLDGVETIDALRVVHPLLPLIVSSGYSGTAVPERISADSAIAFVRKPFALQELLAQVRRLLAERNQHGAPDAGVPVSDVLSLAS